MTSKLRNGHKDDHRITPDWDMVADHIDGVRVKEVRNVVTGNGHTTEMYRPDWGIVDHEVRHIIHVEFRGEAISTWHKHELQTDHIFVVSGMFKIVLFDGREGSPTKGKVDVFHASLMRPTLLVIPPGVWHALQNLSTGTSSLVNFFDRAYDYADPDVYRLPADTPEIPYRF